MNTAQYISASPIATAQRSDDLMDDTENEQQQEQSVELANTFKQGDILYGLDGPRASALAQLAKAGFKRKEAIKPKTKNLLAAIRQSFRKPKEKANILIQNDITNAVWDPIAPAQYSNDKQLAKQLNDPARAADFRQFIESHPKYNVKDHVLAAQQKGAQPDPIEMWKRTSKAGLEFQLLKRKKPLHFMADIIGDDINVVTSKIGHGKSITSSELRWLYRHRDLPEVRSNLLFYRGGVQIPHHEIFDNQGWSDYHPKNQYSS